MGLYLFKRLFCLAYQVRGAYFRRGLLLEGILHFKMGAFDNKKNTTKHYNTTKTACFGLFS